MKKYYSQIVPLNVILNCFKNFRAEIAVESAKNSWIIWYRLFFFPFLKKGFANAWAFQLRSASAEEATKVAQKATKNAQELAPHYEIDGGVTIECGITLASVANQKSPDSKSFWNKRLYLFPELQSGNIRLQNCPTFRQTLKLLDQFYKGLNKPSFLTLSRGVMKKT